MLSFPAPISAGVKLDDFTASGNLSREISDDGGANPVLSTGINTALQCGALRAVANMVSGPEAPPRLGNLTQCGDKSLAIGIVLKNRLAPVAPVHYVINRPGIFHPQLSRHAPQFIPSAIPCKSPGLTPLEAEGAAGTGRVAVDC